MSANIFGRLFRLSSFGESHGKAIGGMVDGCPAGLTLDLDKVQQELDRRKPGQSAIVTQRKESDTVEFLSGIFEGKTTGSPIGFLIRNEDNKSKDYDHLKDTFRPSHADFTYASKYGHRDHRGGGRSSARETAIRVVGGAIAQQLLHHWGVSIKAYVSQVGPLKLDKVPADVDLSTREDNPVRCPDPDMASKMEELIREVRKEGDTIGGVVTGLVQGVPIGWGEPVFGKLHAELGGALLGINAVKGVEFGSGFASVEMRGSAHNDIFLSGQEGIHTQSNHAGGIQGGISNGEDIYFRVAFKPVATLMKDQPSVDQEGNAVTVKGKGRHDPCVVPRAVPIVEAMTALVLADAALLAKSNRLD